MAEKRKFVYKERTEEQINKRLEGGGSNRDNFIKRGFNLFKPKEKENKIRILPPTWEGAEHYGYDVHVHYKVGANNSTFLCPKRMFNQPCAVCDEVEKLEKEGKKQEATKKAAKRRVLAWIIDRAEEDKGPKLWPIPWTLDKEIVKHSKDKDTGKVEKIDKPFDGFDVYFEREGTDDKTTYDGVDISRRPSAIHPDDSIMQKWLDFVMDNPIPSVLNVFTSEYIAGVLSGKIIKKEEEQEPEPEPEADEEKKESEEEKPTEIELSYEGLKSLDREALEEVAYDQADMTRKQVRELDDEGLLTAICTVLSIDIPKVEEASTDSREAAKKKMEEKINKVKMQKK